VIPLESFNTLRELVDAWDGWYPAPDQRRQAENMAIQKARAEVNRRMNLTRDRQQENLHRQLEACRLRLMRELGRYLICLDGSASDLNSVLHRQISRDIAGARRLQECRNRLGDYPDWPPDLCRELGIFHAGLNEGQRTARLLGSELDAALDDPRWNVSI
jgi:hypothetical protein